MFCAVQQRDSVMHRVYSFHILSHLVCHRRLDKVSCTAQQEIVYPGPVYSRFVSQSQAPLIYGTLQKIKDG